VMKIWALGRDSGWHQTAKSPCKGYLARTQEGDM
jgi:hypothetical protein